MSHSESLLLKGRIHSWVAEYDPAGLTVLLLLLSGRRTLCRRRWLPGEEAGSLTAVCLEPAPDSRLLPMVPSAFRAPQSYVLCICHYSKFGQIWTVEERFDLGHFEDLLLIQLRNKVLYNEKRFSFLPHFFFTFFPHSSRFEPLFILKEFWTSCNESPDHWCWRPMGKDSTIQWVTNKGGYWIQGPWCWSLRKNHLLPLGCQFFGLSFRHENRMVHKQCCKHEQEDFKAVLQTERVLKLVESSSDKWLRTCWTLQN